MAVVVLVAIIATNTAAVHDRHLGGNAVGRGGGEPEIRAPGRVCDYLG